MTVEHRKVLLERTSISPPAYGRSNSHFLQSEAQMVYNSKLIAGVDNGTMDLASSGVGWGLSRRHSGAGRTRDHGADVAAPTS